jgi:O-antigen/teichoic acid export membrane protein
VSLLTDTFYPAATRMDARRDTSGLQGLLFLATKITLLIVLPLCLGFIFLGRQFIILWMGSAYASSAIFLIVLTIPQFSSMSQYVSSLVLAGMAKHRVLAYFVLAEGVANLVLSIILVQKIGVIGVAWGTVIPDLICTGLIVPFYALRTLNIRVRDYLVKAYLRPFFCALPAAALGYVFSQRMSAAWLTFAAEAVAMCGAFGVMSWFFCFDRSERSMALARLARKTQKEAVNA